MLVNLSDIFISQGKKTQLREVVSLKEFQAGDVIYPIKEISPLVLTIVNVETGKALLDGKVNVTFLVTCDRCIKEMDLNLDLEFTREVISPEVDDADLREDQSDFMENYYLNIENLVSNEILMNWPTKVLCKDNCKGICKNCGKDLNDGSCECDTFVPDPRMAMIKDIFNANKEV